MSNREIRPDTAYSVDVGWEEPVLLNAMYDRVDLYEPIGAYLLKFFHEESYITASISEEFALNLVKEACLPLVKRDFLYQSEYELHLQAEENMLEDKWDLE